MLSSHLISDLERVCDYLIVMAHGRARLAGDLDDIVDDHRVVNCPRLEPGRPAGFEVIARTDTPRQTTLLVRGELPVLAPAWTVSSVGLEEIVLAYMAQQEPSPRRQRSTAFGALREVARVAPAPCTSSARRCPASGGLIALVATRAHVIDVYGPSGSGDLTGPYVWLRLLGSVLIGVPVAFGAFWGAPMVAGELEAGTHRLVWTQSITRGRWLAVKAIVAALAAVVAVAVFSAAFTWWCTPIDSTAASRVSPANFAQRGIAPIGYTLFALALGVLLGAMIRRTLPAMVATLVGFLAVRMLVQKLVRQHLVAATTIRTDPFATGPRGGWPLSSHTVNSAGHVISGPDLESQLITACHITRATPDVDAALASCAHKLGFQDLTRTIPSSSFSQLQAMEVAIFIALAGLVAGAAVWWVRHRAS